MTKLTSGIDVVASTIEKARSFVLDTLPSSNKERKVLETVKCDSVIQPNFHCVLLGIKTIQGIYDYDFKKIIISGDTTVLLNGPNTINEIYLFEVVAHEYRHAHQYLISGKLRASAVGEYPPSYSNGRFCRRGFVWDGVYYDAFTETPSEYYIRPWEFDANVYMLRSSKQVYGANTQLQHLINELRVDPIIVDTILQEAEKS